MRIGGSMRNVATAPDPKRKFGWLKSPPENRRQFRYGDRRMQLALFRACYSAVRVRG